MQCTLDRIKAWLNCGSRAAIVAAALAISAMAGCERSPAPPPTTGTDRPLVVASIHPLAALLAPLVGEDLEVRTLLPPGRSPHGFELTANQMRTLAQARMLVVVGLHLDDWARGTAANVGGAQLEVVSFARLVGRSADDAEAHNADHHHAHAHGDHAATGTRDDAHDYEHAGPNPHLWLDPVLARTFVRAMAEHLGRQFPQHAQAIASRAAAFDLELEELDHACREALAAVPRREMITFHNAFDLLAARYGLKVVAHLTPIELSPGGEVSPQRIARAIEAVRTHGIQCIYAEPQFPDSAILAIRGATGVRILRLDPLGQPGPDNAGTYLGLMRANLATLVQGQSQQE